MALVDFRVFISSGKPRRVTVSVSSRPSLRLAAAPGYLSLVAAASFLDLFVTPVIPQGIEGPPLSISTIFGTSPAVCKGGSGLLSGEETREKPLLLGSIVT